MVKCDIAVAVSGGGVHLCKNMLRSIVAENGIQPIHFFAIPFRQPEATGWILEALPLSSSHVFSAQDSTGAIICSEKPRIYR